VDVYEFLSITSLLLPLANTFQVIFTLPLALFFISLAFYINEIVAFFSRLLNLVKKNKVANDDPAVVGVRNSVPVKASARQLTGTPAQTEETSKLWFRASKNWIPTKPRKVVSPA